MKYIDLTLNHQRNLPARGFRPSYYLVAMGLICTYGLYKTGKGIREQKYVVDIVFFFLLRLGGGRGCGGFFPCKHASLF